MNLHKGNPDSPTGNLLVFCHVEGKSPLHPDARIIVTNVVVSFVSASSNSFPVVIFPPDSLFSQGELDQLIGLNEFYDVLQVEDFEVPVGMDESEYIQERMENLNQSVIEYVELCRHYIEGRVEEIAPEDVLEREEREEPVSEEAALDSIQDFLAEAEKPRAEIIPLGTEAPGGTTQNTPEENGASGISVSEDPTDAIVEEVVVQSEYGDFEIPEEYHARENSSDETRPDESPLDGIHEDETGPHANVVEGILEDSTSDAVDAGLITPRIQEVAFDTSRGERVRDAMRFLKFNYPKYDIERFERILNQPGHSARKLANLYMQKYRAVFDERYEVAAELKTRIEKLEHSLFPSG